MKEFLLGVPVKMTGHFLPHLSKGASRTEAHVRSAVAVLQELFKVG